MINMEWLIFIIFILALVYFLIRQLVIIYNNMVMLKNNCYKAFANIDVLLKKTSRLDPHADSDHTKSNGS